MATRATTPALGALVVLTSVALGILLSPIEVTAQTRRILEDRGPVQNLDLYWGNTSPDRAPIGPYTFLSENLSGTNPKAILQDAKGVRWSAKWGEEVQAEVAATRLAWAMGLKVEETYYVETGSIMFPNGRPTLRRLGPFIDKTGGFRSAARFERRGPDRVDGGRWSFGSNPLMDDGGYSILVLMDVVMANWDARNANTKILSVTDATGTTDWYMIGDYGACFGKMGGTFVHSTYKLRGYLHNRPVITSVSGQTAHLGFSGDNSAAHASVPLEGVRQFEERAAGLTLKQVEDAFLAAHASDAELQAFAQATFQRIQEVSTRPSYSRRR
jgi:hypothetical protein